MSIDIETAEHGIVLVTVNNPAKRNALGPEEFHELGEVWHRLALDPAVRCVVVTGHGQQAFCSGADLSADFSTEIDVDHMVDRALLKARRFDKPLVAAINGHCVAGGFELMLASDIRVASETALFGLPEVRWGIMPSGGGAMKLLDQIGHAKAMEILLTGQLISADDAYKAGLLNHIVNEDDVLSTAMDIARVIAANSPLAVRQTKRATLQGRVAGWAAREPEERELVFSVRSSADAVEGRKAFLEKRPPAY